MSFPLLAVLVLHDFWPSIALMYYAAGVVLLLLINHGNADAYTKLRRDDVLFLGVLAFSIVLWPLVLVATWLGAALKRLRRDGVPARRHA